MRMWPQPQLLLLQVLLLPVLLMGLSRSSRNSIELQSSLVSRSPRQPLQSMQPQPTDLRTLLRIPPQLPPRLPLIRSLVLLV